MPALLIRQSSTLYFLFIDVDDLNWEKRKYRTFNLTLPSNAKIMFTLLSKIVYYFQIYFNKDAALYFSFMQLIATQTASLIDREDVSIFIAS